MSDCAEFLKEATITGLQQSMEEHRISSVEIVMGYLERIARYDRERPALNSVLEINPEAIHIARSLDAEREKHGRRGPLHGIPVLLKDNIDTGDSTHTSAGSLALADSYACRDSFVAAKLREAGAVLLGKANMTEWANAMAEWPLMPAGFSSRGGQVQNPYGPGRFGPRGSSSGSGVSVAANLVTASVGTDTAGSVLSPAHQNSVVGIRPTVGLVSRSGIIPVTTSWDTSGPLARTVADAAILLGAMAGTDPDDPVTLAGRGHTHKDYTCFLDAGSLRGRRIGVPRDAYKKASPDHVTVMERAIRVISNLGAEVIDPVGLPSAQEQLSFAAMTYEFKPALNAYLGRLRPHVPVHTLRELIDFNDLHPEETLKYGQGGLIASEATSGTLTEPEYIKARTEDVRQSRERGIDAAFRHHRLDALLMPGSVCCDLSSRQGYPSVCVPGGYAPDGQPLGVTFLGQAFSEPQLIAFAYAFEQATKVRRPPLLE